MCENIVRLKSLADLPFEVPEAFEHTCIFELTARVTIRNIVLSIDTRLYKEAVWLHCTRLHLLLFHSAPCMSMHGLTLVCIYIYIYIPIAFLKTQNADLSETADPCAALRIQTADLSETADPCAARIPIRTQTAGPKTADLGGTADPCVPLYKDPEGPKLQISALSLVFTSLHINGYG